MLVVCCSLDQWRDAFFRALEVWRSATLQQELNDADVTCVRSDEQGGISLLVELDVRGWGFRMWILGQNGTETIHFCNRKPHFEGVGSTVQFASRVTRKMFRRHHAKMIVWRQK